MVTCDKFKLDDGRLNTGASLLLLIVRRIERVQAIFSFIKEDEEFLNPHQMVEKLNKMNDRIICFKQELDDSRNENRELRVKQVELMKELQTFKQLYSYTKEIYRYTNLDLDSLKSEGKGFEYDLFEVSVGKLLEDNRGLRKEAMDSLNELIILKRQHDIMVTPEEMVRMEYLKERYEYYG